MSLSALFWNWEIMLQTCFFVLCRLVPRPWQMKFLAMYVHVQVFYIILFVNIHINVHSKIFAVVKQKVPYLHSLWTQTIFRSSHQRCSVKKGVLRNFAKFTGKHLRQSLFFNKVAFSYIIWLGFKNRKAELKQRVKV